MRKAPSVAAVIVSYRMTVRVVRLRIIVLAIPVALQIV